jgi:dimethylargininase
MTNGPRLLAITRDISPAIEHCELTYLERTAIDIARARAEHEVYESVLRDLGCQVQRLPAGPDMADAVFIEDTAVVLDELAVITRPGAASRRVETAAVAEAVRRHRPVAAILAPGTLDGGDVLRIGKRLFVGSGYRSNEAGIRQLRSIVSSQGYTVDAVPIEGCLHLKTGLSVVADDLLLVNPAWVDTRCFSPMRMIEVDPGEPFAANALRIGHALIYPAEHTRTRARVEAEGLEVRPVPVRELAKAESGVTCYCLLVSVT